ncbi:phosphate ABC transporter substrate-binding/OmpA family protein [Rhodobacteraceae bacterium D3-12]|nr:phosphate ABC transporter substrate-binding/OmpA family protein [Rhodobacteraceae bacterium D3-12]
MVRAAFCAALFFFATAFGAVAQDVTLTSHDGAVEISGTLKGFDGEFYRVDTVYGVLTVDGSGVRCEGPGCPSLTDFVAELDFSGAGTIGEQLMPALLEAFARRQGLTVTREDMSDGFKALLHERESGRLKARFYFHLTNTDEGFADLFADVADIAMAVREVRRTELRHAREAGLGDMTSRGRARVLALDALVAVIAPGNPVAHVSVDELAQIFGGKINNWKVLGGPDAPITLHLRDAKSGLGQAVEDRLLKPAGLTLGAEVVRHGDDAALAKAVVADPFGIGVASFAARGNAQALVLTGSCGYALAPARRTVKTEDYPLTTPLFLYLPARRLPKLAREFLSFTRSVPAQLVIRRAGFVDRQPEEISIDSQGDRFANAVAGAGDEVGLGELQDMVAALWGHKRLTTSFRFEAGSVKLDAQSRSNVAQLARELEAGRYDGRRMIFAGFSDGDGPATGNKAISERRAKAVQRAVIEAAETANFDRVKMVIAGFGEAMPMACDDSAWGRQVNRRVEIWVK